MVFEVHIERCLRPRLGMSKTCCCQSPTILVNQELRTVKKEKYTHLPTGYNMHEPHEDSICANIKKKS